MKSIATPVPDAVLLTHRLIKAKVAAAKAAMDDAAQAASEAEYRAVRAECVA